MTYQDIILLAKKIAVGLVLFIVPLLLLAGILWLVRFYFFK